MQPRVRPNDQRVREAAGTAVGISPERVFVELDGTTVIVNLPNTMTLTAPQRSAAVERIQQVLPPGLRVSLV